LWYSSFFNISGFRSSFVVGNLPELPLTTVFWYDLLIGCNFLYTN
jgi:hypothetical protein